MKKVLCHGLLLMLLFGCKSELKLLNQNRPTRSIAIGAYELYQFTMYRDLASDGDKLVHPEFTAEPTKNSTVHEILYILRDPHSNRVIYLTTYSHKYLYRNRGALNDPIYQSNLIFNDLDHVYLGKESEVIVDGELNPVAKFSFYRPTGRSYAHNLHMYFTERNGELSIDSLTNDYALERDRITKPLVRINEDVFAFKIRFKKVEKAYSYLVKNAEGKRSGQPVQVDSILIQGSRVYLHLVNTKPGDRMPFFRDGVRYIEPY